MKNGTRIAIIVTGAVATLVAAGLVAIGGLALWGDSQKDSEGYLTTSTHQFEADTRALATENLDLDLGDADWIAQTNDLGDVRIAATSRDGKPLFVGIARTSDVESYLADVPHTTLTEMESSPFRADYARHSGQRHPVSPEHAGIWAASTHGNGQQAVDWHIEDGDWSVVVMNADGSLGVDADINAGAKVPFLDELGWSAIGSGSFALIVGIGLFVLAGRRSRTDAVTPAAAA
jgi:hypothetical protein